MCKFKSALKILLFLLSFPIIIYSQTFWQQTNGPEGAAVSNIAVAPNGYIYAASGSWYFGDGEGIGNGGVYRSTNGGVSWQLVGFVDRAISSIAVGPNNEIYVSMLDNEQEFNAQSNYGVYYSGNNGDTWTNTGLNNYFVPSLLVLSNGNVYAGTSYRKIFQYTGGIWVEKFNLDGDGVKKLCADNSNNIYALFGSGIYKSSDMGTSWNKISALTSSVNDFLVAQSGRFFIQDNVMRGLYSYSAILYSDNGGTSWTDTGITVSGSIYFTFAQGRTGTLFSLDPGSGSYRGLKRSTDNGITWQTITLNSPSTAIKGFASNASNELFMGSYSGFGIFKSTDDGLNWNRIINGLKNTWISSLKFDSNGNLYAGSSNGLHYSSNNGTTWQSIWNTIWLHGESIQDIAFLGTNTILAATKMSYIQKSTNNGANWELFSSGIANTDIRVIHKTSESLLLAGTNGDGIFRTTNAGTSWTRTSGYWSTYTIVSEPNGNILASAGASIYRSTDQGATWNSTALVYGGSMPIRKIAVNSSGHIFAATDIGLYRSTDLGVNWTRAGYWKIFTSGSSPAVVYTVIINSVGRIFVGVGCGEERGVYVSNNNGDTWQKVSTGLSINSVRALALNSSQELFAGTYYNGVFKSNNPTTAVDNIATDIPKNFILYQNYPNPFNPATKIKYSVPFVESHNFTSPQQVTIKIYDLLGRDVMTLVNESKAPGTYNVNFDRNRLPSGIYFYAIQAGSYFQTRKMILLK